MSTKNWVASKIMQRCVLNIFDKVLYLDCGDEYILDIVLQNFGHFSSTELIGEKVDFHYNLKRDIETSVFSIVRNEDVHLESNDLGMFVYQLEKDITVKIQHLCQSLFFMHGAALEKNGEILLLTGRSGAGKSTTTWGLLNNGFNYLSDELAPINLDTMYVSPYPHAVCLKSHPPLYPLPEGILKTNRTMHIPVEQLPSKAHLESFPLTRVIIVEFSSDNAKPELTQLSQAEACINIYTNGLNQLAHDNDGLAAASKIASKCDCYTLAAAKLDETCELIKTLF